MRKISNRIPRSRFDSLRAKTGLGTFKRFPRPSARMRSENVVPCYGHEIAKMLLVRAGTFLKRSEAVKLALEMGMPLHEIEEFLDEATTAAAESSATGR